MGAGKTTTGRKLANLLGYRFFDLDTMIEKDENLTVTEIFRLKGEPYFRNKEASLLRNVNGDERLVISTGGGLPCFLNNMKWMNEHGITVYLKMSPEALCQRLRRVRHNRPLIAEMQGTELLNYIRESLKIRETFYLEAHIIMEGKNLDVQMLARNILAFERN